MIKRAFKVVAMTLLLAATTAATAAEKVNKEPFSYTKGNTTVKFGGFVNLTTGLYLSGSAAGNDFITNTIPAVTPVGDGGRLILDPTSTRLNLSVTQSTESIGDIKFYIEVDFRGSGSTIRMRHAYFTVKNFTFGQTWSIMTDAAANAPVIDVQGLNARSYFRTPQISYKKSLDDVFSVGASLEMQTVTMTTPNGDITKAASKVPDFGFFAQAKGDLGHIRFANILRSMPYVYADDVDHQFGWGVQLSGSINATDKLRFYGQSIYGKGIGRYINDLMSQSMDIVESVSAPSVIEALPMYGVSAGAKYDISKTLSLSASYGSVKVFDKEDALAGGKFKQSEYISTTLFYKPMKSLQFGFEYLHGARRNVDNTIGDANKINLMTRFVF